MGKESDHELRERVASLTAERDEARRELQARELHHFETEQENASLRAEVRDLRAAIEALRLRLLDEAATASAARRPTLVSPTHVARNLRAALASVGRTEPEGWEPGRDFAREFVYSTDQTLTPADVTAGQRVAKTLGHAAPAPEAAFNQLRELTENLNQDD